jgi:thioredoxin 1
MSKQSLTEYLNNEDVVLVDFFAEWCGPCKTLAPILQQTKSEIDGRAKIIKIDIDKNQHAASHFQVRSVPTLILFKKGKMVWRQSGIMESKALANLILSHV